MSDPIAVPVAGVAHKPSKSYVRLSRSNDWGRVYFALWPHSKHRDGTASANRGIRWIDGETVDVRWADGSETVETITTRNHYDAVSDMGRVENVRSKAPCIKTSIRGVQTRVDLDEVDVSVEWYENHKSPNDTEPSDEGASSTIYCGDSEPPFHGKPLDRHDRGAKWERCSHVCSCHPRVPILVWDGERWNEDSPAATPGG